MYFKKLSEDDDVQSFNCGANEWEKEVSNFLKEDALDQQRIGLNVTWLCYSDTHELKGYVSLIASSIRIGRGSLWRPWLGIDHVWFEYMPCILIGQFGVQQNEQHQGIGGFMIAWVRGALTELVMGAKFLTLHVHRENNGGLAFWKKQGFEVFRPSGGKAPIYMVYDLYSTTQ